MIQPDEIYMADFGPAGPHPVIAVSRETLLLQESYAEQGLPPRRIELLVSVIGINRHQNFG